MKRLDIDSSDVGSAIGAIFFVAAIMFFIFLVFDAVTATETVTDCTGEVINLLYYSRIVSKSSDEMHYDVYVSNGETVVCVRTSGTRFAMLNIGDTVQYQVIKQYGGVTGLEIEEKLRLK